LGRRTVEFGCGQGKMSMLMAARGAVPTLVDYNLPVLRAADRLWRAVGLRPSMVVADVLRTPLRAGTAFDIAMSFGTAEHFLGEERLAFVRAHVDMVRPGGLIFLSVPNRWALCYRLAHGLQRRMGRWPNELPEVPFTRRELHRLAETAGASTLRICCGDTVAADFAYHIVDNVRAALYRLFRRRPAQEQNLLREWLPHHWSAVLSTMRKCRTSTLLDECFAYPLLLIARRPRS